MKTTKLTTKLMLNKNTVANLDFKALSNVMAGEKVEAEKDRVVTRIPLCTMNCCTQNTSVYPGMCC